MNISTSSVFSLQIAFRNALSMDRLDLNSKVLAAIMSSFLAESWNSDLLWQDEGTGSVSLTLRIWKRYYEKDCKVWEHYNYSLWTNGELIDSDCTLKILARETPIDQANYSI